MAYAIIRIEKRQIGSCAAIEKHHERKKEQYKSNPDIDSALTPLNYHLVSPAKSYRMTALERIEEVGAKRRKDSVILQDGLLTASPEWIRMESRLFRLSSGDTHKKASPFKTETLSR